ncbi:hypothetical protein [Shewanella sedimentimangrovi]|uniref:Uncharacterized protein n=1 Tax=Shewanella sedimentimangrovi TaxID=2814293 RepID=A0ABX7R344_9GAMM|nr:hypothetical protein [Shewanella sedimentimangrovi]QSX37253.1 hypothetical protein JYB85_18780 [Shewanella sedimentimangrovi]
MKGWIILALVAGGLYYLYTETDKLDEPIAQTEEILKKIERKLDAMTSTRVIRVDRNIAKLKSELADRFTPSELSEFNSVLFNEDSLKDFKEEYCGSSNATHPIFSSENLLYLCDHL